ncbi:MAG: hypothetical protein AABX16_01885, partial [Nanoarchaeota archaeon]
LEKKESTFMEENKQKEIVPEFEKIKNNEQLEFPTQKEMPPLNQKIEHVQTPPQRQIDNGEYNQIKKIMTNNTRKEIENNTASLSPTPEKKSSLSEIDLIKKIMTNQRKDKNDKKEEKKNGDSRA